MSSILEQQFRAKWGVWAALGAGCLVGMSGLMLVQRLALRIEHTSGQSISHELASLHSTIRELQEEVRQIKKPPLKSALRTVTFSDIDQSLEEKELLNSTSVSSRTSTTDYYSAISSDEDEFFDLPTDSTGEATPTNENVNPSTTTSSETDDLIEQAIERLKNTRITTRPPPDPEVLRLLWRTVDHLMEGTGEQQKEAYALLGPREVSLYEYPDFLWRYTKSIYLMAMCLGQDGDLEEKRKLIFEAVEWGKAAIKYDENNSEAHKWYAIIVGSRGGYLGVREKIIDGHTFKQHIDRAAILAPNDHTIRHLLGRFCYEVAGLTWWERKMASALFAEVPEATMEEAKDHFMAAEELKPDGWKENRQFLAKSYIQLREYNAALYWLDRAAELPVKNPDDRQAQLEIDELLKQYQCYR